ncbi:hypothetical protein Q9L58_010549 [Maublancomyces gigas]|uniref:Uncharacterized protein n=1 Tax=Discina gigas TaxID=1032678 RepID=A0ABR3G3R6_9PEZI
MPKAGHNALEGFLNKRMIHFALRKIITEEETDQIQLGFGTDMILPYHTTTRQLGRKAPAIAKQPDAFFAIDDNGKSVFPRVVFEVRFSQSYAEVLDDVHQWLVHSEGRIPLVVLIYIEEHPIADCPDDAEPQSDDSADSNASMYQRLRDSCHRAFIAEARAS